MVTRYVLHELIDVVLKDDGKTIIEVDGNEFVHCSYVLITVNQEVQGESIDEIIGNAPQEAKMHEGNRSMIPKQVAFFTHCSNLQAWVDHGFDTRLLDSRLSFPLLKRLAELGDEKAQRVFEGEIVDRIKSGFVPTIVTILDTCFEYVPDSMLRVLARHDQPLIQEQLVENDLSPPWLLETMAGSSNEDTRTSIAGHHQTPARTLVKLADDTSPNVRAAVAGNENASGRVLFALSQDAFDLVRIQIANNNELPSFLIERLSRDKSSNVRAAIGRREEIPVPVARCLAMDNVPEVRAAAAGNASLPVPMFATLLQDSIEDVRLNLAGNCLAPSYVLEQLAREQSVDIRARAAANPSLPEGLFILLSNDPELPVRVALAKNNRIPPHISRHLFEKNTGELSIITEIAGNHNTPVEILKQLAKHPKPEVREHVSLNSSTPEDILEVLKDDEEHNVRSFARFSLFINNISKEVDDLD